MDNLIDYVVVWTTISFWFDRLEFRLSLSRCRIFSTEPYSFCPPKTSQDPPEPSSTNSTKKFRPVYHQFWSVGSSQTVPENYLFDNKPFVRQTSPLVTRQSSSNEISLKDFVFTLITKYQNRRNPFLKDLFCWFSTTVSTRVKNPGYRHKPTTSNSIKSIVKYKECTCSLIMYPTIRKVYVRLFMS